MRNRLLQSYHIPIILAIIRMYTREKGETIMMLQFTILDDKTPVLRTEAGHHLVFKSADECDKFLGGETYWYLTEDTALECVVLGGQPTGDTEFVPGEVALPMYGYIMMNGFTSALYSPEEADSKLEELDKIVAPSILAGNSQTMFLV